MNNPSSEQPRRVIPRWRDFRTAAELGELSHPAKPSKNIAIPPFNIDPLLDLWKVNKNEAIAGEVLSAAWLLSRRDLVVEAARFLLRPQSVASPITKELALSFLEGSAQTGNHVHPERAAVQNIRRALRAFPNDAIGWSELARFHAIRGDSRKAYRAIRTSLSLAPNSRFIIRSAIRCLIHIDQSDLAHQILSRAPRTSTDPWLLSAHIAVASILDKSAKFYKIAKSMGDTDLPPFQLAELLASLATVELEDGNDKKAKKLLNRAIVDPTENVAAQAWWAHKKINVAAPLHLVGRPHGFEADTLANIAAGKWELATASGRKWFEDELFSSRPAVDLSFIHAVAFEEHREAIDILSASLIANEDDPQILNNLAFSQVSIGDFDGAHRSLDNIFKFERAPNALVAPTATLGMMFFREGNPDEGRKKYLEAMELARVQKLFRARALAALYLAKEETRAKTANQDAAWKEALNLVEPFHDSMFQMALTAVRSGPISRKTSIKETETSEGRTRK